MIRVQASGLRKHSQQEPPMQAATPEADDLLPRNVARVPSPCICNTASPPVVKREGRSCEAQSTRTGEGGPTTGPGEATMPTKWRRSSTGEAALAQAQRNAGRSGGKGPNKSWVKGGAGAGVVRRGKRRGGADDGERRSRLEDMCFGENNGQWIDRVWLKLQRSSPSGAAFMLDARWGSVAGSEDWTCERARPGTAPEAKGNQGERARGWEEEDDGNITSHTSDTSNCRICLATKFLSSVQKWTEDQWKEVTVAAQEYVELPSRKRAQTSSRSGSEAGDDAMLSDDDESSRVLYEYLLRDPDILIKDDGIFCLPQDITPSSVSASQRSACSYLSSPSGESAAGVCWGDSIATLLLPRQPEATSALRHSSSANKCRVLSGNRTPREHFFL
ncbi:hypothetical protein B0H13DRAFT_1921238 [Mycena leptocephala]|nr:hypothetical protein B0H13DRAFT_1921238 [Mycena leptocephala]